MSIHTVQDGLLDVEKTERKRLGLCREEARMTEVNTYSEKCYTDVRVRVPSTSFFG